ncbi:Zinc finger CCCH domain protein [Rhynchospora pubera]|uniref:Zinc finger CCCH domain protein n=1 Tax=Rhynchospora pubera TaxID=906938 RepID=A0AAV8C6N6_9POAL|nr:Zinc finger CCCH domain protein [Rhynchospora pubera]KAJ4768413.1 Zinc finger CCCH domain protein [Rhynchospora pubera]
MPLYDGTSEQYYSQQPIPLTQFRNSPVLSPHYAELLHHHEHDQRMRATMVNSGTKRDDAVSKSDEFMMYQFKVRRCPTGRGHHDWTDCHFLHPGEKARRRDPRKFVYSGKPCANFKKQGQCENGDKCHFAHGVFETWLHPDKYKTQMCRDGRNCDRKVCFFAHSKEEMREGDNVVIQDMSILVSPKSVFFEHQSPSSSPPMSPTSEITQGIESLRLGTDQSIALSVVGRGHNHSFIRFEPEPIAATETVQEPFIIDWIVELVK